jgi:hypothetical protein
MGMGSNWDWVRRTQSCSGTAAMAAMAQPSQKCCSASRRALPRARRPSAANSATTRERDQLCAGGGRPGSPNMGALGRGVGVGVLDRDAQRLQRLQRVGQGLDPVFLADQAQFEHGR